MKILILGIYRTGTTSLQYGIVEQGYTPIFEPYNQNRIYRENYEFPISEIKKRDNLVVKCLTDQLPKDVSNSSIEFYSEFVSLFDTAILLSRKNKEDHLISFLHQLYHRKNNLNSHKKYELKMDLINKYFTLDFITESKKHLLEQYKNIEQISLNTSIPITYYEDLYNSDKDHVVNILSKFNFTDIDITDLSDYLSITKRYRTTKTNII